MGTVYGLIGRKLGHSVSPQIHGMFFDMLGITGYYHLFEIEEKDLGAAITGLKAIGAVGANITIPYKVSAIPHLDTISDKAQMIGSVNTIVFKDGSTKGFNTDYNGFAKLMNRFEIPASGCSVSVLGYGGAAKAVVKYFFDSNANCINIYARNAANIRLTDDLRNSGRVNIIEYSKLDSCPEGDIIVNCTPCGMYPDIMESPATEDIINRFKFAVDLIYNPQDTLFLKHANNLRLKSVGGLYMLVAQAAAAQELWNNVKITEDQVEFVYKAMQAYFRQYRLL